MSPSPVQVDKNGMIWESKVYCSQISTELPVLRSQFSPFSPNPTQAIPMTLSGGLQTLEVLQEVTPLPALVPSVVTLTPSSNL